MINFGVYSVWYLNVQYTDTLTYDCENIKGAMSMYGSSKTAMTQLHPAQKKVAALFIL